MSDTQQNALPNKKTIIASTLAIILEWYDFSLFGFYAIILSKLFFPFASETTAILSTFMIFALSFLFRPLGSLIIGSIGDRFGRKNAFILTVVLMTFPTVLIGLLPTYETIGIAATVLLIILRIGQALSVGGERSATLSLFTELAPPNLRGVYGSMSLFGTTTGILLASAICGLVSSSMSEPDLISWGWRIPFLLGALTGIAALFLRKIIEESEIFRNLVESGKASKSPVKESLIKHWRSVLVVLSATIMFAVSFYLIFVYIITFGIRYGDMPLSQILNINTIILGIVTLLFPASAYLSDRVGRKPSLIVGCSGMILIGFFLFTTFSGDDLIHKIIVQLGGGLFMVLFAGAFAPFMVESFPTRVRMSGISLGNVIGFSVFGGSAPLVASYLISSTGSINAPGIYLSICSIISLIAVLTIKETYKNKLG
ncbi:MAG: MFS transporter [Thermodesulfobacteriota bacterium]|nr:MAG: MFS transporter [Thermodesulfobacteriota bacterium]